ncbi:hypothetical protein LY76DRAFT_607722 [Colletotrichum caudatum]|nr:hypothetical protein LY76DRAFT_607722 [Colletotrichum caudatum]
MVKPKINWRVVVAFFFLGLLLGTFKDAPDGDTQFKLAFLSYGAAQFLFSTLSSPRPSPHIQVWTGVQVAVTAVGLVQFRAPVPPTLYGAWVFVLFVTGACVGSGVTKTDFKIGQDFRRSGESDGVRELRPLGVMVQQIATKALLRRTQ